MVVFNLSGDTNLPLREDTGNGTDVNSYIQAAESVDIQSFLFTPPPAVPIHKSVLPQNLQDEITACDGNDNCKLVAYDFDSQQVSRPLPSSNIFTLDLSPYQRPNTGVFVKKENESDVMELTSLVTYDLNYESYIGTTIQTIHDQNVPVIQRCGEVCESNDACEGFNYRAITNTCDLITNSVDNTKQDNQVSLRKSDIASAERQVSHDWVPFNSDTSSCISIDECNQFVSSLILQDRFEEFSTGSFEVCRGCPPRGYHRLHGPQYFRSIHTKEVIYTSYESSIITNEHGDAKKGFYKNDAIHLIQYNKPPPPYIQQWDCYPGTKRLTQGGICEPCTDVLPPNSVFRYLCEVYTCSDNTVLTILPRAIPPPLYSTPSYAVYCASIPYGYTFYTNSSTGLNTNYRCRGVPPIGYKFTPSGPDSCPTTSCNNTKTVFIGESTFTIPIPYNEIYVEDPKIMYRWYPFSYEYVSDTIAGCRTTRCPSGTVPNSDKTQCVHCPSLGLRERYQSPITCDKCSVPAGSMWGPASFIDVNGYSMFYRGCNTVPCTVQPTSDDQIWDMNSSDMCAITSCSVDQMADATRTSCITRPGLNNACESGQCTCTPGSTFSDTKCIPCNDSSPGYKYMISNSCTKTACTNTIETSNIWHVECSQRTCYAGTYASSDKLRCLQCAYDTLNTGNARWGPISNVPGGGIYPDPDIGGDYIKGCSMGRCPEPSGNYRWKYGSGCDWVRCLRTPSTNERWASTFGCDIVSYTGSTVCSVFPTAGNAWSDTTTCNISQCPQNFLGPRDLWGPGCTKIPTFYWDDRPNSSKTYALKCAEYPQPGQRFSESTPCVIEQCQMTPATGYVWTNDGSCATRRCTNFTYPNATNAKCIPCPSINGWYPEGNACRVLGCSTRTSLLSNQYWSGPNCEYNTCTSGNQIIDQTSCAPCTPIASGNVWSSPGVTCNNVMCMGQTKPNDTQTSCISCGITATFGFTFDNVVSGCTPLACPAIASSNIWITAGSCDNVACSGHTQPDAAKTSCVACPTPPLGNTWTEINGCSYSVCPAIDSSNVFTTAGTCDNVACTEHTQPDATKTSCVVCPDPPLGNTWSSTDGCSYLICPPIQPGTYYNTVGSCSTGSCTPRAYAMWDPTDTQGQCKSICDSSSLLPGQKLTSTCDLDTFRTLFTTTTLNLSFSRAPTLSYYSPIQPTHYMTTSGGFTFDYPSGMTHIRIGTNYFMKIAIGFNSWVASNSNEFNVKQKIWVYFTDKNGNQLPSTTYGSFSMTNVSLNFGNITQFACSLPAPGYEWDSGCTTKACSITPAPGNFWDPNGGCRIYSCTNDLGITLGYNQFWAGTGCVVSSCPIGTVLQSGTCIPVCDSNGITLPSDSIYVPRTSSINVPTIPAFELAGWPDTIRDVSINLTPGVIYNVSTCLQSTQTYSGTCPPFNLTAGTADCVIYAKQGSRILAGTSVTSGNNVGDPISLILKDQFDNIVAQDQLGLLDFTVQRDGPYTIVQVCTGTCSGMTGYSGAVTEINFPQGGTNIIDIIWDANGVEVGNSDYSGTSCSLDPPFYTGKELSITVPLDAVNPMNLGQMCRDRYCTGQTIITIPSQQYCAAQQCTGRTAPDLSRTICQACSTSPGTTWATTDGCTSVGCTPLPSYGNTWNSTDTNGQCLTQACPVISSPLYWSGPLCATSTCAAGTTVSSNKLSCVACAAIASNNRFTTAGSCVNTSCTGHTQPDANKTTCIPCTCPSGKTWAATDGCVTTACPFTPLYGNVWDSTDTNGECRQVTCSYKDLVIPGKYFGTTSCTRLTCSATLISGNGWDPTYDTAGTCRQTQISYNNRFSFKLTVSAWSLTIQTTSKIASDQYREYRILITGASSVQIQNWMGSGAGAVVSGVLQAGYTHLRFNTSAASQYYFVVTTPYTLTDTMIYGYFVNSVTNLRTTGITGSISQTLSTSYPISFGTMCPRPITSLVAGQYYAKANTCTVSTCSTAGYGQYYTSTDNCNTTTCATLPQVNQYYATTGTCMGTNCPQILQGTKYSSSRTDYSICPTVVSCPTALTGGNGWVTDLSGLGTCAQKILTWNTVATVLPPSGNLTDTRFYVYSTTTTQTDIIRMNSIYIAKQLSNWGSGVPSVGYTHIKFVQNMINLSNQLVEMETIFQITTTPNSYDLYIYGVFVNTLNVKSSVFGSSGGFMDVKRIIFGYYS